jgi:anti-sigma factor ChrR (cupin superfamily)
MTEMKTQPTGALDSELIAQLAERTPPAHPDMSTAARVKEKLFQRVKAPAADYLFVHSHEGEWVRLLKGVEMKLLRQDEKSRSFMLRMAPGARIPPHGHAIDEESLVLQGDVTINGIFCRTGDYHLAPGGKPHDWLTTRDGCLLFIRGAVGARRAR